MIWLTSVSYEGEGFPVSVTVRYVTMFVCKGQCGGVAGGGVGIVCERIVKVLVFFRG